MWGTVEGTVTITCHRGMYSHNWVIEVIRSGKNQGTPTPYKTPCDPVLTLYTNLYDYSSVLLESRGM